MIMSVYERTSVICMRNPSPSSYDIHYLSRVPVNEVPVSQGVWQINLNDILAVITTSERCGEGLDLDLHVNVRLP